MQNYHLNMQYGNGNFDALKKKTCATRNGRSLQNTKRWMLFFTQRSSGTKERKTLKNCKCNYVNAAVIVGDLENLSWHGVANNAASVSSSSGSNNKGGFNMSHNLDGEISHARILQCGTRMTEEIPVPFVVGVSEFSVFV